MHPDIPPPEHTTRPTRRPRRTLWLSIGGAALALLLAAAIVVLQATAGGAYDSALDRWNDAVDDTEAAQRSLAAAATTRALTVDDADAIVAAAPDGLVDTSARDSMAAAAADLSQSVTTATGAAAASVVDSPGARPTVFWELLAGAGQLRSDADDLDDGRRVLTDAAVSLDDDAAILDDAAGAVYTSAEGAGLAFEAAHIDARNAEVIAFRDRRVDVSESEGVGAEALAAMTAYSAAAAAVSASEQDELAALAGPLYDAKLAAQAFARSIDGGVLVEFDWAPTVSGAGENGSVGGFTTWNFDHGGRAVIALSDSVAARWPDDVTMNLIAHEVGHAISAKCPDLYDHLDQASIESFATAWAIGMGYTGDGNGAALYGQPSQELIDSAATCR